MLWWLLAVELVAAVVVVAGLVTYPPRLGSILGAVCLAALGVLHTEMANSIEQMRRRVANSSYFDLSSVWTFGAAMLLAPAVGALVVVVIYIHLWARVWRPAGAPMYRHVYTMATVVLACTAASAAMDPHNLGSGPVDPLRSYPAVLLAMVCYVLVNQVLVAIAVGVNAERRPGWKDLVGEWDDHILEVATLCLAVLGVIATLRDPVLIVLVLPPLLVLHRAVLIRQLEERADTDAKTGLLTAAAWRDRAGQALQRARRTGTAIAVLILDLDHFKAVNDTYGHLAGDDVLGAVAAARRGPGPGPGGALRRRGVRGAARRVARGPGGAGPVARRGRADPADRAHAGRRDGQRRRPDGDRRPERVGRGRALRAGR